MEFRACGGQAPGRIDIWNKHCTVCTIVTIYCPIYLYLHRPISPAPPPSFPTFLRLVFKTRLPGLDYCSSISAFDQDDSLGAARFISRSPACSPKESSTSTFPKIVMPCQLLLFDFSFCRGHVRFGKVALRDSATLFRMIIVQAR